MRRISRDRHACLVGQTPVILDVESGRYQLVRGTTGEHLAAFLAAQERPDTLAALAHARLLDPPTIKGQGAPQIVAPRYSQLDHIVLKDGWRLAPIALFLLCMAVIEVRRNALPTILHRVEKEAVKPNLQRPSKSLETIAASFELVQQFLPFENFCLPRSIAIARLLRHYGYRPTLVIGVQLPIAAHCWVQCDDALIGDRLERIAAFEPIVAL